MAKRNVLTDKRPQAQGLRPKSQGPRQKVQRRFPKSVATAVRAALDKKAEDVVVLDLRKAGGFTDFFVICTGGNSRQITAIADGVRDTLKRDLDERPVPRPAKPSVAARRVRRLSDPACVRASGPARTPRRRMRMASGDRS